MTLAGAYRRLGVAFGATIESCRRAWRKIARQTHPDLLGHRGRESEYHSAADAWRIIQNHHAQHPVDVDGGVEVDGASQDEDGGTPVDIEIGMFLDVTFFYGQERPSDNLATEVHSCKIEIIEGGVAVGVVFARAIEAFGDEVQFGFQVEGTRESCVLPRCMVVDRSWDDHDRSRGITKVWLQVAP